MRRVLQPEVDEDLHADTLLHLQKVARALNSELNVESLLNLIIDQAVQIFGGTGVVSGVPVERFYREIRALRIYEGTSEIQKLIIAGEALKAAVASGQAGALVGKQSLYLDAATGRRIVQNTMPGLKVVYLRHGPRSFSPPINTLVALTKSLSAFFSVKNSGLNTTR